MDKNNGNINVSNIMENISLRKMYQSKSEENLLNQKPTIDFIIGSTKKQNLAFNQHCITDRLEHSPMPVTPQMPKSDQKSISQFGINRFQDVNHKVNLSQQLKQQIKNKNSNQLYEQQQPQQQFHQNQQLNPKQKSHLERSIEKNDSVQKSCNIMQQSEKTQKKNMTNDKTQNILHTKLNLSDYQNRSTTEKKPNQKPQAIQNVDNTINEIKLFKQSREPPPLFSIQENTTKQNQKNDEFQQINYYNHHKDINNHDNSNNNYKVQMHSNSNYNNNNNNNNNNKSQSEKAFSFSPDSKKNQSQSQQITEYQQNNNNNHQQMEFNQKPNKSVLDTPISHILHSGKHQRNLTAQSDIVAYFPQNNSNMISNLEQENQELKLTNIKNEEQIFRLMNQIDKCQKADMDHQEEIEKIVVELNELQQKYGQVSEERYRFEEENQQLQKLLIQKDQFINQLQEMYQQSNQQQQEKQNQEQQNENLKQQYDQRLKKIEQANQQLEALVKENEDKQKKQLQEKMEIIQNQQKQNQHLEQLVANFKQIQDNLEQNLQKSKSENSFSQKRVESLQRELNNVQNNKNLEQEVEELINRNNNLQEQLSEKDEQLQNRISLMNSLKQKNQVQTLEQGREIINLKQQMEQLISENLELATLAGQTLRENKEYLQKFDKFSNKNYQQQENGSDLNINSDRFNNSSRQKLDALLQATNSYNNTKRSIRQSNESCDSFKVSPDMQMQQISMTYQNNLDLLEQRMQQELDQKEQEIKLWKLKFENQQQEMKLAQEIQKNSDILLKSK